MTESKAAASSAGGTPVHFVLFNDLEFAPAFDKEMPTTIGALIDEHKCRIYEPPALLFDKRWLGTDAVSIQLHTSSLESSRKALQIFQSSMQPVTAKFSATANAINLSEIVVDQAKVVVDPLVALAVRAAARVSWPC